MEGMMEKGLAELYSELLAIEIEDALEIIEKEGDEID